MQHETNKLTNHPQLDIPINSVCFLDANILREVNDKCNNDSKSNSKCNIDSKSNYGIDLHLVFSLH